MSIRNLGELSHGDLLRIADKSRTVIFFSVGTLEDQGPHLPLHAHVATSRALAEKVATDLTAILPQFDILLYPDLPLGIQANTTDFSLVVRPHVLRDALVDVCHGLWKQGFRQFVGFGTERSPRLLTLLEEVQSLLRRKTGSGLFRKLGVGNQPALFISACSALVDRPTVWASPLAPDPAEHAGTEMTSILLQIQPNHVSPTFRGLPALEAVGTHSHRQWLRWQKKRKGYWGNPASATAEQGAATLSAWSAQITPRLKALFESKSPAYERRRSFLSGYGWIPLNRSFFKIWLLTGMLFVVLLLWVTLALQTWPPV